MNKINSETKLKIAKLYHQQNLSIGNIAKILEISERTVQRYKNYNLIERPGESTERPNIKCEVNDDTLETLHEIIMKTGKNEKDILEESILDYYLRVVAFDAKALREEKEMFDELSKKLGEPYENRPDLMLNKLGGRVFLEK